MELLETPPHASSFCCIVIAYPTTLTTWAGRYRMYEILKKICDLLKTESIDCCFVGELALNYYNVPRVIHVSTMSLDDVG
jgi:hypothetical protein